MDTFHLFFSAHDGASLAFWVRRTLVQPRDAVKTPSATLTRRAAPTSIPDAEGDLMKTLIQGGWVVGYDGHGHELIPNGCVVFEDDRLIHVGRAFTGAVDRRVDAAGKLVSPGLINCHLHAATNATQSVFLDGLKADYFASNFVGYVAPRRGVPPPRAGDRADLAGTYGLWAALRAGSTTILDVGTMPGGAAPFTKIAGELGVRAYLGPAFRSAGYAFDGSRIVWEWDEAAGLAGLERAIAYIKEYDGAYDGRIRTMLYPGQLDTCTPELLRQARRWADDLGVPMQLHAAMNQREFHQILERHGQTPIQLLHSIGFLKPRDDLGRLAPGAKADIIVVDLLQTHYGAVHDPIKSLVECGSGRDVETVIVDGQTLIENNRALKLDEAALLRSVQAEGERLWHAVPQWHWSAKPLDDIVPPSYPVRSS